jgi:hypothetical protein
MNARQRKTDRLQIILQNFRDTEMASTVASFADMQLKAKIRSLVIVAVTDTKIILDQRRWNNENILSMQPGAIQKVQKDTLSSRVYADHIQEICED